MADGTSSVSKKPFYKRWWFIAILVLAVIGYFASSSNKGTKAGSSLEAKPGTESSSSSPAEANNPESSTPANGPEITKAEFNQIATGMSKTRVESIVGGSGEVQSESEVMGSKSQVISYKGTDGISNAVIIYSDGKVMSKSQIGLE